MSLRMRLLLGIGSALLLLWGSAAIWMLRDLDRTLERTLDQRLLMSANMVAGLIPAVPPIRNGVVSSGDALTSAMASQRGTACQIKTMRGEVIATTAGAPAGVMQASQPGYGTRTVDGQQWRTFTLEYNGMRITTADHLEERNRLHRSSALAVGLPFLIAAVGGLLALWWGVGRGLAPLTRLREALSQRQPMDAAPLPEGPLPRELKPLVQALNHLLQRNADAMAREREFTSNAAHELRTPLTAISTHLQVAALTTGQSQAAALDDAAEGSRRMAATLDQLLMLARVEGDIPFDGEDLIAADALLQQVCTLLDPLQHRIRHDPAPDPAAVVPLALPAALAVAALRNLVDNALRYSADDAAVEVSFQHAPGRVHFQIRDHGPGVDPALATRRLWRAGKGSGSGLGLAVTGAIVTRFNGQLDFSRGEYGGMCVRLTLPTRD